VGFHANTSKWRLNNPHSSFRPSYVRVDPIAMVCSGWIATWIFSSLTWLMADRGTPGSETIEHSSGMILLLCNVTIPPATGNFIIPCAVDGISRIFLTPDLPIIPLSKSIAAIWLEKVVTPLIEPAIKGLTATSADLKPERLKVDKHDMSEPMSYYLIDWIEN
nr:hypothetical protein [Tanacetum cinerariifolium]